MQDDITHIYCVVSIYSNVYFIKHKLKIEQYCHGNKVLEINNKLHSLTNGC